MGHKDIRISGFFIVQIFLLLLNSFIDVDGNKVLVWSTGPVLY